MSPQSRKIGLSEAAAEKEAVLQKYSELNKKEFSHKTEIPLDMLKSGKIEAETSAIIADLKSPSPDVLLATFRNIEAIADSGNHQMEMVVPSVVNILENHIDEKLRYEATKVLSKIGHESASEFLICVAMNDTSEKVKDGAIRAIGYLKSEKCFANLVEILENYWEQSIRVRSAAAFALGRLNPKNSAYELSNAVVGDPDPDVRREAAEALSVCLLKLDKEEASRITEGVGSQISPENEADEGVRIAVINAITVAEAEVCIDKLVAALEKDPSDRVRGQAAHALSHYFDPRIESALVRSLAVENEEVKKRVALAIAHYAIKNPIALRKEISDALIYIQKYFPKGSYIWKEAVKALPAC